MRTTLDLPVELITEAMEALQSTSLRDTVVFALREVVRRQRLHELKGLAGQVPLEIELRRSRRRPR